MYMFKYKQYNKRIKIFGLHKVFIFLVGLCFLGPTGFHSAMCLSLIAQIYSPCPSLWSVVSDLTFSIFIINFIKS